MNLTNIPHELLLIITDQISDPCDLLALRLTHTSLNSPLSKRFSTTFPRSTYTYPRDNSYRSVDGMLFWASQHSHSRFLRKLLTKNSWPGYFHATFSGLRHAAINCARFGNLQNMILLQYHASRQYPGAEFSGDLFEAAITEDQLEIAEHLIRAQEIRPSFRNEHDYCMLMWVLEAHRLDLFEYIVRDGETRHWGIMCREAVEYALDFYADHRCRRLVGTWCQRTLYMLLQRNAGPPDGSNFDITATESAIEMTDRRNCGPECEVWFGVDRRIEKEEMLRELGKIRQGEYKDLVRPYALA